MNNIKNWIKNKPIAHRGLHDDNISIPENSLLSFEKAMEKNYPIEIDVQITKDDTIIVFHDKNLLRACGQKIPVSDLSMPTLNQYTIFNSTYNIPTLKETLELINGKVPLLIEIKNFSFNRRLEKKLIEQLSNYKGDFALQSFNPFSVSWIKKHSSFPVGQLAKQFSKPIIVKNILNILLLNKSMKIDFVAIDKESLPNKKIEYWKSKGLPILCWTVTTNEEEIRAKKYCDNIIFEKFNPINA
ncbi:MAG: glycerophosphodiester phosphodiesterase [Bacteroidetes bacterium]|nr:glycerophosphodiester phosphodiesterase [Bacteroidota bacterium]